MFEKLKRAKSFIVRTKTEELDLSESSHLRRGTAINTTVLNQQRKLAKLSGAAGARKNGQGKSQKQLSASNEVIYDDKLILEQIRRINFGTNNTQENKQLETTPYCGQDSNHDNLYQREARRRHSTNDTNISFLSKKNYHDVKKVAGKRS